ncbi:DUF805 domain-containing protein [Asticcacaulis sp. AC402]|uniref:DUF805 domain-containing protein n=1 Tax=Asticcacaulis sp. AC402 TaxID=1282361 RepID=UPI00138B0A81|nr:DUF805 domain-containing protein [Asticcacaulis sp. AC402]
MLLIIMVSVVPAFLPLIIARTTGVNRYGPAPRTGLSLSEAVQACVNKYAQFQGRASRSEYWWFYLACLIAGIVLEVLAYISGFRFLNILALAWFLPGLASVVRRLHDNNRSGFWILIGFGFGVIPLIYMLTRPTQVDAHDKAKIFE